MRLEDEKVLVKVDAERFHDVFVGCSPDQPKVTLTVYVPNAQLHLPMSPAKARDIAAALVAFAEQVDAEADGRQFHRESRS